MLRNRIRLSVLAGRLSTQVLASVIATLLGSAIFALLPTASGPDARLAVELTSGGKFAARIPGAAPESEPVSEESRTTTPAGAAGTLQAVLDMGLMPLLSSDVMAAVTPNDGGSVSPLDKPARSRAHTVRPALLRHAAETAPLPLARPTALAVAEAVSAAPDEGVLPKVMSSARSLWSFSASTGAALVSRFVP